MLEKGYLNVEENRKILVMLTSFQASQKQYDIVVNRLNAELKAAPDDAELKLMLGKVYLADSKTEKGVSLIEEVILSRPEVEEPYLLLSQAHLVQKDSSSAREALIKGRDNVSRSLKIPMKLAALYETEGNHEKAISLYREVNTQNPDNLVVINNLASMLSDYGNGSSDLEDAKTLIIKLEESNQPIFLDTIGWVYYKLGDSKKAIEFLSDVVEKAPQINIFNYHLGMAYKLSGDKEKAKIYLEKSLAGAGQHKNSAAAKAALQEL